MNRAQRRQAERLRQQWLSSLARRPDISDEALRVADALSEYADYRGRITDPEVNEALNEAGGGGVAQLAPEPRHPRST